MPLLRRLSGRVVLSVVGLAIAALLASTVQAKTPRQLAEERYRHALVLLEDLHAVPKLELGPRQYLLVVDAFKSVHRASPASGYCDDALLSAAEVYAEMSTRFGPDPHRRRAVQAYKFLIREYPHSKLLARAEDSLRKVQAGESVISRPTQVADEPVEVAEKAARETADTAGDEKGEESTDASADVEFALDPTLLTEEAATPAALPQGDTSPTSEPTAGPAEPTQADYRYAPTPGTSLTIATEGSIDLAPTRTKSTVAAVQDLRFWRHADSVRIVVELDDFVPFKYDALANPSRLYFDLFASNLGAKLQRGASHTVDDPVVRAIRLAQNRRTKTRLVLDLGQPARFDVSWLANPPRMVLEVRPRSASAAPRAIVPAEPAPVELSSVPKPVQAPNEIASTGPKKTFEQAFNDVAEGRPSGPTATAPYTSPQPRPARATLPPAAVRPRPGAKALSGNRTPPAVDPDEAVMTAAALTPMTPVNQPRRVLPPNPPPATRVRTNLPTPRPAKATSRGTQNMIRALGLKIGRIVIDAGHGGHDTGSIGPTGLREKDVVLDISVQLGKLIHEKLGAEVLYTRQDDRFLPLRDRTKVANDVSADLFISVHANSYSVRSVRGIETYYLSLSSDPWALKVAARENAAANRSVHELQDLLSKIAFKDNLDESREFATRIQSAVYSGLAKSTKGLRDRGVRKAPMLVLMGAKMPAILAEVGFLSNPGDEALLKSAEYRRQVARHLYEGVASYVGTLSDHRLSMTDEEQATASLD